MKQCSVLILESPNGVRAGCRERVRTFHRKEGGLVLAAGNAIMPETPVENIRAYLETLREPASS